MKISSRPAFMIMLLSLTFPIFALGNMYAPEHEDDKELERTANHLHIPVVQLKQAREILQETTDLAQKMDPYPVFHLGDLASGWVNLYRSKAEIVIESFIMDLQHRTRETNDLTFYERATYSALQILISLMKIDPEKALYLARTWPDPPEYLGELARRIRDAMKTQTTNLLLIYTSPTDPEFVTEQLKTLDLSDSIKAYVYSNLIEAFAQSGKNDKVQEIIAWGMRDFTEKPSDSKSLENFHRFLSASVMYMDAAQADVAMVRLIRMLAKVSPTRFSRTLKIGEKTVAVNANENLLLGILYRLQSKPRLLLKTLALFPELESKLEVFGGIDNYLSAGDYVSEKTRSTMDRLPGYTFPFESLRKNEEERREQFLKLNEDIPSRSESVKSILRENFNKPDDIRILANLARYSSHEYPELAHIALSTARDLLDETVPWSKRASGLKALIRAYRDMDGEVPEELMRFSFVTAVLIRQELKDKNAPLDLLASGDTDLTAEEREEVRLLSEMARFDYEKTMRYVRGIQSERIRLACLIGIARALYDQSY